MKQDKSRNQREKHQMEQSWQSTAWNYLSICVEIRVKPAVKKKLVFNNLQYLERDKNHNSEVESYKLRRMRTNRSIIYKNQTINIKNLTTSPDCTITSCDDFHQRWVNWIWRWKVDIEHKAASTVRRIYRAGDKSTDKIHTVLILRGK